MKPYANAGEAGVVLFTVVTVSACLLIMAATITIISYQLSRITYLNSISRQAYWLARAEAKTSLSLLLQSDLACGTTTISFANGWFVNQVVTQPKLYNVTIAAHAGAALDTIVYSYDPASHSIVNWQDNGASP